jgi:NADH:ubiquinone oxidoreductase subunit F (NADH-binding)
VPLAPAETRVLAGPPLDGRAEPFAAHVARLGPLPGPDRIGSLIGELEASGLLGRGGAGFPVGRKWRSMAGRSAGRAVVVANGAEGELASAKDRVLMAHRPHLVLDGALLAADAVGATEVVLYVGREHVAAVAAMKSAVAERRDAIRHRIRLVTAPETYVAGEATAAVHYIDAGVALPMNVPPRVSERGVDGRPTLVQNVESLAQAALIARHGADRYRSAGRDRTRGTALVTVGGASDRPAVLEIELGTTVGEVASAIGATSLSIRAVLLGGYFGTWADAGEAWDRPLDPELMRADGLAFGCGLVGLLPADACGVAATARIVEFLATESAGQCGPCVHGLRAIADATNRLAAGEGRSDDLANIERWLPMVAGRGACHHPDGAVQLVVSALAVFGDELLHHARYRRCPITGDRAVVA